MNYMTKTYYKNPCPRGRKIDNFSWPFLGHDNYILALSDLYLGVEKKSFREKMQISLYELYGHAPAQKPLPQGVMKFTIMVDFSLVIINTYMVCLIYSWE